MRTQKIGYARVSTLDQNLGRRLNMLRQHSVKEIEELTAIKKAT